MTSYKEMIQFDRPVFQMGGEHYLLESLEQSLHLYLFPYTSTFQGVPIRP